MIELIRENYTTYYNTREHRREGHTLRLCLFLLSTLIICIFADGFSVELNNMMITGLTILTGFTFTALFSDHSLADIGLPKPRNENDRFDLTRLGILAHNFHIRSRYFIALSIIDVCILIGRSIKFSSPDFINEFTRKMAAYAEINTTDLGDILISSAGYVAWTTAFISIFIFLECLYTFYRLSETIIAIVNTRRAYMKADND